MVPQENVPILIVDDRPENLVSLETVLCDLPVDLYKAGSGNDALRHTLYTDFALVLLDVHMPEMNGFETAELMRRNPRTRQLPIIFITAGMKDEHHLFKGYENGAVDYLMKPFDPYILKSKVKVFCELFEQRRRLQIIQAELERQNDMLRRTYQQLQEESAQRVRGVEELRKRDQMMIQQNRMAAMGEMLNNIAHQWRQPLNVLGLRIQHMALCSESGEVSPEMVHDTVEKAMEVVRHLSQTIDDFRTFSLPEKKKTVFEVGRVVAKTVSLVEESLKGENVRVDVSIGGAPTIHGYANEFSQVLLNLLMNAKDAIRERGSEGGRIQVSSWMDGELAFVSVADNAGGIAENIIGKVFDPYFTTKGDGKGTGLGLFMSKNIIETSMGGRINVENSGGGARFTIELPGVGVPADN